MVVCAARHAQLRRCSCVGFSAPLGCVGFCPPQLVHPILPWCQVSLYNTHVWCDTVGPLMHGAGGCSAWRPMAFTVAEAQELKALPEREAGTL